MPCLYVGVTDPCGPYEKKSMRYAHSTTPIGYLAVPPRIPIAFLYLLSYICLCNIRRNQFGIFHAHQDS